MAEKALATAQEKNICDNVLNRVNELSAEGLISVPMNYSPANALKSAYLILQEAVDREKKPVLQSCSKVSISNALLDMVIQGLSPAKKQCYFIPYGGKLQLMRSYLGTVAATKRLAGVKDVKAHVVYEGDEFDTDYDEKTGNVFISKYKPNPANIDNTKIVFAFAVILGEDKVLHTEVMNMHMIKKAWAMSKTYRADSKVHNEFADQMCKKTVTNRACKNYWNTSDDSDILLDTINKTEERNYDEKDMLHDVQYDVKDEIAEKANQKEIDIVEEPEVIDVEIVEEEGTPEQDGVVPF